MDSIYKYVYIYVCVCVFGEEGCVFWSCNWEKIDVSIIHSTFCKLSLYRWRIFRDDPIHLCNSSVPHFEYLESVQEKNIFLCFGRRTALALYFATNIKNNFLSEMWDCSVYLVNEWCHNIMFTLFDVIDTVVWYS